MQYTLRSLFLVCLIALSPTAYSSPSMSRTIEYDSKENVKKVIYSDGSFIQYAYDSLNQVTEVSSSDEAELSYDSKGNLKSITNQAGIKQRFWYNQSNQLTASQDGRGWCTLYTYDEQNRLKSIHPKSHITFEDPVTGKIGFHYEQQDVIEHIFDDHGEFSQFFGGKHLRSYCYDSFGRLTSISDPYGYKIMRCYDDRFRLTALFDRDGGYDFQYNDRDQVTQIDSPVGSVKYDYDIRGNLTRTTDPNGNITLFEYDNHHNLVKVIDAEGAVTLYEYTALGTLSHITLPNGSVREIEYNSLNHPVLEVVR